MFTRLYIYLFLKKFLILRDINIKKLLYILFSKVNLTIFALNFIFLIFTHALLFVELILVKLLKNTILIITLKKEPLHNIWKWQLYDAFEKIVY